MGFFEDLYAANKEKIMKLVAEEFKIPGESIRAGMLHGSPRATIFVIVIEEHRGFSICPGVIASRLLLHMCLRPSASAAAPSCVALDR